MLVAVFWPLKHRSVIHIYGDAPVGDGPVLFRRSSGSRPVFFFTFMDTVASGIRWFLSTINSSSVSRGFAALRVFCPLHECVAEFSFSVCSRR